MAGNCFRINAPDVINETIDGEAIILHLGTGCYYSARGCGAQAWSWLSTAAPIDVVIDRLEQLYDADHEVIRSAVNVFVESLCRESLLVETDTAAAPPEQATSAAVKQPFEAPLIERFTDLQDLLLLDPVHEVDANRGWPHTVDEAASVESA